MEVILSENRLRSALAEKLHSEIFRDRMSVQSVLGSGCIGASNSEGVLDAYWVHIGFRGYLKAYSDGEVGIHEGK